ncbi:hypothetical protein JG688_00017336 [Phytophthora aleatoria]|uniref:Uncharacterized protein n=1 Tax=Phytophthora aleatoria TaxID=2496075 RepID=A0A8J5I377_9STRA|nr:hypothetical protein JG688_00017336 [Phytophthora aleatoria]
MSIAGGTHTGRQLWRVGASARSRSKSAREPAKQGREIFAEAGPAPSSTVSRTLHSPDHPIFLSRAKPTAGTPKGLPAKRSAAGPFSVTTSNPRLSYCDTHEVKSHLKSC